MSRKRLAISIGLASLLIPFTLMAQPTPTPTPYATATLPLVPTAPIQTAAIEIGQTIDGRFSDANATYAYQFEGHAGQVINVVLQNTTLSSSVACLTVNDASFTPLTYSTTEYGTQGSRAVIPFLTLPGDQLYTLNVSACGSTGEFQLKLLSPAVEPLPFNTVTTGQVNENERVRLYRVDGLAGDLITVNFEAFAFSPIVDLTCAEAVRCGAYAVSIMNGYNANPTSSITLPADAPYLLTVRTQDYGGDFRLAVNRLTSTPIYYGDSVQAVFDGKVSALHYKFSAVVGDTFITRAISDGSLDTRLTLIAPDGSVISQDDDSANGLDPEILNQLVYASGDYTIVLEPSLGEQGTVTLNLVRIAPAPLDQGVQQLNLTGKQATRVASFSGVAGEKVRVNAHTVASLNASPQLDIRQDGIPLVNSYASGSDTFSVELTVPNTGDVIIFVSGGRGLIELSLDRLGQAE